MKTISPRSGYKATVRAQILAAAREIFVRHGYEAFTIRALAKQVGYSPAAMYKHFTSKGEIFASLVEESFAILTATMSSIPNIENENPIDRMKRGMWAYVNFGLTNPDHYRLAFLLEDRLPKRRSKSRAVYAGLRFRVACCLAEGRFAEGDAEVIAQSLWTALHGATALLIQRPFFPWVARKKLISQLIETLVKGLSK